MKHQSRELLRVTTPVVSPITIHRQSLQAGAFEFIPLPFIDEWLIRRERRSLVRKVFYARGLRYERKVPLLLADGGRKTILGRVGGWIRSLFLKPLQKIFRTFFFWLTVRRAVLTMMETYFLARFVHLPELDTGQPISEKEAAIWGEIFKETVKQLDRRIAYQGTRKLWSWMMAKRQAHSNSIPQEELAAQIEKESPGILADFDERVRIRLMEVSEV